jgi:hypothetical protein
VQVDASQGVALAAGSRINTSGAAGGGMVAIGTTLARAKGGPGTASALTANTVQIAHGARIAANATADGDGGRVTVLSSLSTSMAGNISAKGGPQGGDGGFVEVSGDVLTLTGLVNASAPLGKTGTLLLDPTDLWIADSSPPNAPPGFSYVSPATLESEDANISLSATGNLFVATTNGTSNTLSLPGFSLSLTAGNNLTVDRGFAITAFSISLTATSGAITLDGSSGVTGGLITANQLSALGPTSLQVTGSEGGDGDVTMSAGTGIALADSTLGSENFPIGTLDLSTGGGVVTQAATGTIVAGTLTSSGGLNGNVSLLGTANDIAVAGDLVDTGGDITLVDNTANLTLSGTITGNNLFFEVAQAGGTLSLGQPAQFNAGTTAELTGASGDRISLVADNLTETKGSRITVVGGSVELAPFSSINTSLGGTIGVSNGLVVDQTFLSIINTGGTGTLVAGGFTNVPANATTPQPSAATMSVDGSVDLSGRVTTLDLLTNGAITEPAGPLTVGTLSGNAGTVTLGNNSNDIGTLGSFAVTNGVLTLADGGNAGALTVTGPVTASGDITLTTSATGAINATGSIGAGSGATLSITSGSGGITLSGNADLTGGTVNLDSGSGGISLIGNAVVGQANAVVDLTAGAAGVTEFDSSTIVAATLQGNVTGPVQLGNDNTVLTVGSFTVTGASNSFALRDTGTLAVTGPLTATGDVDLNVIGTGSGNAITINGSISAGGTLTAGSGLGALALGTGAVLTGPSISLEANGITLTGNASVGGPASVVSLGSFGGAITEASTSTITAATLQSTSFGSEGSVSLLGTNNAIGALGAFTVFGSSFDSFTLIDSIPLTVTGPVNANNPPFNSQNVVLEASGSITVNAAITASGDIILATGGAGPITPPPATANPLISVQDAAVTSTGGSVSLLAGPGGTVQLGANLGDTSTSGTLVAGSGQLVTLQMDTLSMAGASSITAPGGTIEIAPATQGDAIDFATTASNTLTIPGSAIAAISAGTGALRLGAVTINGIETTTAGAIAFDAPVDLTGHATTLLLLANGPISEPGGPLTVNTLTANGTAIDLPNASNVISNATNMIATAGDIVLVDDPTLVLSGIQSGNNLFYEMTAAGGTLQIGSNATGATLTATAASNPRITLVADNLTEGTAASTITATNGSVELAPFTKTTAVSLAGSPGVHLLIDTTLLADISTGTLLVGGFTDVLSLATGPTPSAASISIDGPVDLTGRATTLLLEATGPISEPGGPLTVNTLAADGTAISLPNGNNAISNLSTVSATTGNIAIADSSALTIAGLVDAVAGNVYLETSAGGGITFGAFTVESVAGGTVGLQTNALVNLGSTGATGVVNTGAGGTFELSPDTANPVTLGTTSGLSLTDLTGITAGTLRIGAVTQPGNVSPTIIASSVTIGGNFGASGIGLELDATGQVTESTGVVLTAGSVTGTAADFQLANAGNAIRTVGTLTATNGDIVLVDSVDLALTGAQRGNNLFFEVAAVDGTLSLGRFIRQVVPATLTAATGDRIALVADTISALTGSTVTATNGVVELAPFSAINASLLGSNGLVIGTPLLTAIAPTGTLVVGGFTNVPNGLTTPAASAASVSVDGAVDLTGVATTLLLQAKGPISEPGGPLTVNTLAADGGAITLQNPSNAINFLGGVNSTSFALDDKIALSLDGGVIATVSVSITDPVSIKLTSSLTAPAITFSAGVGGIALDGGSVLGQTGATVDLTSTGGVNEAAGATLIAGTLQSTGGVTGGAADFAGTANAIATLGGFMVTGNPLTLSDTGALSVTGPVTASAVTIGGAAGSTPTSIVATGSIGAGGILSLTAGSGGITLNGAAQFTGTTIDMNAGAGGIALNGTSVLGQSGATVDLTSTGGVNEVTGATLIAGTLQSTGGVTGGPADFGGTANAIATLGGFTVTGNPLSLSDTGPLSVTGPVIASAVTIGGAGGSTPSAIVATGSIGAGGVLSVTAGSGGIMLNGAARFTGTTVDLNAGAGGIALNGTSVLGQGGATVDLTSAGGVNEATSATLTAALLQSSGGISGGAANLAGTANAIGTLGNLVVTGGALTLSDTGTLGVTGAVTANSITIGGGSLTTPTGITLTGDLTAPTITLSAGGNGIALNGTSVLGQTGATVDLTSAGGVNEIAGATLIAGTLRSTGGVTGGPADFGGTANAVTTLGSFTVTDAALSLSDTGPLSVTGPVTANAVTIGGAAGSTPAGITLLGDVAAATITLSAGGNGIALNGSSVLGQSGAAVDLTSAGGVNEVAGATLIAGTLRSTGGVTGGPADFGGTANAIATLAGFAVNNNPLSLSDTGLLAITGPVTASAVTIGGAGGSTPTGITLIGSVTAPTIALSAGGSGIALNSDSVLGQSGATVDLTSAGGVNEAAGATLTAGTLQSTGGVSGGTADFAGTANAIAALGGFAVSGNPLTLSDTSPLSVTGAVSATTVTIGGTAGSTPTSLTVGGSLSATSAVTLTAGAISIPGLVSDGGSGTTTLTATTGGITESGTLISGTLTGSAAGAVSLVGATPGSNQVATLDGFTAPAFTLDDGSNLLVSSVLTATNITLSAPTSQITLAGGASIVTGGVTPPSKPGPLIAAQEPSNGAPGTYIQAATFTQVGSSTLRGQGNGTPTLQISISKSAQFDPPLGLQAGTGWLILNLGAGTAGGDVFVKALNVTYDTPGSANLFGTIDGISGKLAAASGFIQPSVNGAYLFNGCDIGAPACLGGTLTQQQNDTAVLGTLFPFLPGAPPPLIGLTPLVLLADPLVAPPGGDQLTDPDVVPPNVSYVDY